MTEPGGPAAALPGPDGRLRCPWALSAAEYVEYHDTEWGVPVHGDDAVFERISLEAFQSGLSWLTILRKRQAFRAAFAGFRIDRVARFGEDDVARLMSDVGIVRNRAKVLATVGNARAALRLLQDDGPGALDRLVWSSSDADGRRDAPVSLADVPSATTASRELAAALKRRGFTFVGPTTAYAAMQAIGVVDDHLAACFRRR